MPVAPVSFFSRIGRQQWPKTGLPVVVGVLVEGQHHFFCKKKVHEVFEKSKCLSVMGTVDIDV
jgi:hypothetical protein